MRDMTTLRFKQLSDNIINIAEALIDNEGLVRLLMNIEQDNPYGCKADRRKIFGEYIRFEKYEEDSVNDKKAMIFISPRRGYYRQKASLTAEMFEVNILVPNEFAFDYTNMVSRSAELASLVVNQLDQQPVAGVGRMWLEEFDYIRATRNHNGWTLIFRVTSASYRV